MVEHTPMKMTFDGRMNAGYRRRNMKLEKEINHEAMMENAVDKNRKAAA